MKLYVSYVRMEWRVPLYQYLKYGLEINAIFFFITIFFCFIGKKKLCLQDWNICWKLKFESGWTSLVSWDATTTASIWCSNRKSYNWRIQVISRGLSLVCWESLILLFSEKLKFKSMIIREKAISVVLVSLVQKINLND